MRWIHISKHVSRLRILKHQDLSRSQFELAHLGQLPQGQPERASRADAMQRQIEAEGFGSWRSNLECDSVCPQKISTDWISWMHRDRRS